MSRRAWLAVVVASALVIGACGIPLDSEAREVQIPTPTPLEELPTPTPLVTQPFTIYLTDAEGRVRPAERQLPVPLTISAVMGELIETPTEQETERGLVTLIPPETQFFEPPEGPVEGKAIIDLMSGSIDTLQGEFRGRAVAQIVWTLTTSPEIDAVEIHIEGVPEVWPTDGDDRQVLTRDDYLSFDPERVEPTPEPIEEPPVEEEPPSEEDG